MLISFAYLKLKGAHEVAGKAKRKKEKNLPLFRREIPICDSTIPQILPDQDIDAADHMPHHAIAQDDDLFEPCQSFTDLLGGEPTHVTTSGHVRRIKADASSTGHGIDKSFSVIAEGSEGGVEIERGYVACVAVFVCRKRVNAVREAVRKCFRRLKGGMR